MITQHTKHRIQLWPTTPISEVYRIHIPAKDALKF